MKQLIYIIIPSVIGAISALFTNKLTFKNSKKSRLIDLQLKMYEDYKSKYVDYLISYSEVIANCGMIKGVLENEELIKSLDFKEAAEEFERRQEEFHIKFQQYYSTFSVYDKLLNRINKQKLLLNIHFSKSIQEFIILPIMLSRYKDIDEKETYLSLITATVDRYLENMNILNKITEEINNLVQECLFNELIKGKTTTIHLKSEKEPLLESIYEMYRDELDKYVY